MRKAMKWLLFGILSHSMKEAKCKDFKVMISITKRLQEIKMSFNNQTSKLVLNEVNEEQKDFRGVKKTQWSQKHEVASFV